MKRFLIIGGGAAGMLASVYAARNGMEVHLFEQNEKLGKKLFITGKGRCNFTNGCATEELFESFITNPRFLYSAVYGYTNYDVIDFFEIAGVKTKMERGGRMFPLSDHSSDIIRALEQQMKKAGVKIHLGSRVKRLLVEKEEDGNARITGIQLDNGEKIRGEQVLVATGGNSYPSTGSTGDGYRMAKESGHTVTDLQPSLVPMVTAEEYIPRLQGLSLKNVTLSLYDGKKCVYEDFGEMMFTHFGITGPLVLSASAKVGKLLKKKYLTARIDLKPALTAEQLDARLLREFEEGKNKQFKNVAGSLFPAKLLPVMLDLGGIAPGKKVHEITREERAGFIEKIQLKKDRFRPEELTLYCYVTLIDRGHIVHKDYYINRIRSVGRGDYEHFCATLGLLYEEDNPNEQIDLCELHNACFVPLTIYLYQSPKSGNLYVNRLMKYSSANFQDEMDMMQFVWA